MPKGAPFRFGRMTKAFSGTPIFFIGLLTRSLSPSGEVPFFFCAAGKCISPIQGEAGAFSEPVVHTALRSILIMSKSMVTNCHQYLIEAFDGSAIK
jgi:hypothetical protein